MYIYIYIYIYIYKRTPNLKRTVAQSELAVPRQHINLKKSYFRASF